MTDGRRFRPPPPAPPGGHPRRVEPAPTTYPDSDEPRAQPSAIQPNGPAKPVRLPTEPD